MRSESRLAGMKSRSLMFALMVAREARLRVIPEAPPRDEDRPALF